MTCNTNKHNYGLSYFYDGQLRRYTQQFIRIFSGFKIRYGDKCNGATERRVPAVYGDISRMAATILKQNSANILSSAPFISCYTTDLAVADDRRQTPSYIKKAKVAERTRDPNTGQPLDTQGNAYLAETLMPVPYDMTMNVDIWTTNRDDKDQLIEQILVLFNPSLDLQTSTNVIDWTALTTILLTGINWSSRGVPQGVDDQMDILTLTFTVPIWLNPPARISKQVLIRQVITNMNIANTGAEIEEYADAQDHLDQIIHMFKEVADADEPVMTMKVNPNRFSVVIEGSVVKLHDPLTDTYQKWQSMFDLYKYVVVPGTSKLVVSSADGNKYSGYIFDTSDELVLKWVEDYSELPPNTIKPVDKIIDPTKVAPGNGINQPSVGDRYLIVKPVPLGTTSWNVDMTFTTHSNDIIEYTSHGWVVSEHMHSKNKKQYTSNIYSGQRLIWDKEWIVAPDGTYKEGDWGLR